MAAPLAIHRVGLLTAVGTSAPASCAAFRAKVNNPRRTEFMDSTGEWIVAHRVPLPDDLEGRSRLVVMAGSVIREALPAALAPHASSIPLVLCVAEQERQGRLPNLDASLINEIQASLKLTFARNSSVVAEGRAGVAVALALARTLLTGTRATRVLIVATDSLLQWQTIEHYQREGRLLTQDNSNGFMVGEGAGALLVGAPDGEPQLRCTGMGFARELSRRADETPCRADGLTSAIKDAVGEARLAVSDCDFRIADLSGEHYYFRESALAIARTMRESKEGFDLWHPAECTGEAGALAGAAIVALAHAAAHKNYAPGPTVLAHMGSDAGLRAALTLQFTGV